MKMKDIFIIIILLLIIAILYYKIRKQKKEFLDISNNKLDKITRKIYNFTYDTNNIINSECYDLENNKCLESNKIQKINNLLNNDIIIADLKFNTINTNKICFDNNYCIDSNKLEEYKDKTSIRELYKYKFKNVFNSLEMLMYDISSNISKIPSSVLQPLPSFLIQNNDSYYNKDRIIWKDWENRELTGLNIKIPTDCNYNTLWLLIPNNKYATFKIDQGDTTNIFFGYITGGLKETVFNESGNLVNGNAASLIWVHTPIHNFNKDKVITITSYNTTRYDDGGGERLLPKFPFSLNGSYQDVNMIYGIGFSTNPYNLSIVNPAQIIIENYTVGNTMNKFRVRTRPNINNWADEWPRYFTYTASSFTARSRDIIDYLSSSYSIGGTLTTTYDIPVRPQNYQIKTIIDGIDISGTQQNKITISYVPEIDVSNNKILYIIGENLDTLKLYIKGDSLNYLLPTLKKINVNTIPPFELTNRANFHMTIIDRNAASIFYNEYGMIEPYKTFLNTTLMSRDIQLLIENTNQSVKPRINELGVFTLYNGDGQIYDNPNLYNIQNLNYDTIYQHKCID